VTAKTEQVIKMETIPIKVDSNFREQICNEDVTFPVGIWTDVFSMFVDCEMNCHWHDDFEFGFVLSGEVEYFINENLMRLYQGDCVFVNSNAIHMAKQAAGCDDAVMFSITFPASLFAGSHNSTIYHKYFAPVLGEALQGFKISQDHVLGKIIRGKLNEIYSLDRTVFGYELLCLALIIELWKATVDVISGEEISLFDSQGNQRYIQRAKEMLSYIHLYYPHPITIDDITKNIGISRSECFRCFKRFTNKNPVEYINEYRLAQAARLLWRTDDSITEVCVACGFASPSYFGKLFKEKYGVSPLKYRRTAP